MAIKDVKMRWGRGQEDVHLVPQFEKVKALNIFSESYGVICLQSKASNFHTLLCHGKEDSDSRTKLNLINGVEIEEQSLGLDLLLDLVSTQVLNSFIFSTPKLTNMLKDMNTIHCSNTYPTCWQGNFPPFSAASSLVS